MLRKARRSSSRFLSNVYVAFMLAAGVVHTNSVCRAELAVETPDVLQFDYQQVGATEEEAVRLASLRAVRATVGRIQFSNYSLQARDLLEPYLEKNWNRFVASTYVLERRVDREGFGVRIRVQTYPELLHRDLREKKFLYLPEPNPYYAILVSESIEGNPTNGELSWKSIAGVLENEGLKVRKTVVLAPGHTIHLNDRTSLDGARGAAIQAGAEALIVGSAQTRKLTTEQVYLSDVVTYETALDLRLIRVDDGRVLGTVQNSARVSETDLQTAGAAAVNKALSDAAAKLVAQGKGIRSKETLDKTAYSLMFTDLTAEEVQFVSRHLESQLSYGTKVYLKSWYGNVAILNIDTERAYAALERALISFKQFDLRIKDRQGKRITVDVQH